MALQFFHQRRPAITEQHYRAWVEHVCLQLVPNQRYLRHGAHAATQSNEADRAGDQALQAFVEMFRRDLLSQEAIRLCPELIHRNADDAASALMRTATRRFHHAAVSAGANGESRFDEQGSDLDCLRVLVIALAALCAAEACHHAFRLFAHSVTGSAGALARSAPSGANLFPGVSQIISMFALRAHRGRGRPRSQLTPPADHQLSSWFLFFVAFPPPKRSACSFSHDRPSFTYP